MPLLTGNSTRYCFTSHVLKIHFILLPSPRSGIVENDPENGSSELRSCTIVITEPIHSVRECTTACQYAAVGSVQQLAGRTSSAGLLDGATGTEMLMPATEGMIQKGISQRVNNARTPGDDQPVALEAPTVRTTVNRARSRARTRLRGAA
jgi:hypothetical protein